MEEKTCRVRVRIEADETCQDEKHLSSVDDVDESYHLIPLADCPNSPEMDLRVVWCRNIMGQLAQESYTFDSPPASTPSDGPIRPWDFTLHLDGAVYMDQRPNDIEQRENV
jgi:hypothetical protein